VAEDTGQERTEQATAKRLQDAREKGQVPRSRELNTALLLMASSIGLLMLGPHLLRGMTDVMKRGFQLPRAVLFDEHTLISALGEAIAQALTTWAPFFLLLVLVALGAPMLLGGWNYSTKAMQFKFDRLNPLSGLKRVFAVRGAVELTKALAKFAVVAIVLVSLLWLRVDDFMALGGANVQSGLHQLAGLAGSCFVILSSALLIIAAVDVPFQLWDHAKKLRMTRQEIKDEFKETDGSPEIKSRVRQMQREIAQRRMMAEIPKADVIITNPTHYAVALRYDQKRMAAPIVVAKGADLIAMQIRNVGAAHDVAIVSAPSLTRAIYFSTEINHPIPVGLYLAVAQVLAYVFQMRAKTRKQDKNTVMDDLPIPDEFRRD